MLISVHMPKAGGTTFLSLFESIYGDSLLRDYDDKILSKSTFFQRKNSLISMSKNRCKISDYAKFNCIHGHFMPLKYRFFDSRDAFFLTWLRHPVQRLMSHYHYWSREPLNEEAGMLRRRFVKERWSLRRFCLAEELRDIYSRILWGFPLKRFDFVGITEFFQEDVAFFTKQMFGRVLEVNASNLNPDQKENMYSVDKILQREIEHFHKRDMAIYREALRLRNSREKTLLDWS